MSEPREVAEGFDEVCEGVWHWQIANAAIGGQASSSHAVLNGSGSIFIDPVRLADAALERLPRPEAVALTAKTHQRSAWRYRRELGAEVWLSADAPEADERPYRTYAEGDELPGGLVAIRTPGPERPHYAFLLRRQGGVLFVGDLVSHDGSGTLELIPLEYHEEPEVTKRTVAGLLDLPFSILCFSHGPPLRDDPKAALRALVERG